MEGRRRQLSINLRLLGIDWIVVRGDIRAQQVGKSVLSSHMIEEELKTIPNVVLKKKFGPLRLYQVRYALPLTSTALCSSTHGKRQYSLRSCRNYSTWPSAVQGASLVIRRPIHHHHRLLIFNTPYSPWWRIVGLAGRSVHWRHVKVGYINGWMIRGTVPRSFRIVFGPERLYIFLQVLSGLMVSLALGLILWVRLFNSPNGIPAILLLVRRKRMLR